MSHIASKGIQYSRSYSSTLVVIGLTRTILFQSRIVPSSWLHCLYLGPNSVIVTLSINRRVIVGIRDTTIKSGYHLYCSKGLSPC